MFCPRCGTEYPAGVAVCSECRVPLVDELPDADVDLVPVLVTSDPSALAIAQSLLEAEGIECELQGHAGQEVLGLDPLPGATGPARLLVASEDEAAARALLTQPRGTPPVED